MNTQIKTWLGNNPYKVVGRDYEGSKINYWEGTYEACEEWIRTEASYYAKLHGVSIAMEPMTIEDAKIHFNLN